jgi:hypothetical protein
MTAIVEKDLDAFHSTLYTEGDYLDFFITENKYRFTEIGALSAANDIGRRDIGVGLEVLSEGFVRRSNYTFSMLLSKDGEWKVGNID